MPKVHLNKQRPDVAWALANGWEFKGYTGSNHLAFRHSETNRLATLSLTPSKQRSVQKAISQLRRLTPAKATA
jgi:predicted RNA binding protein YcfA (HicA-like mRNA interferase family)